MDILESQKQGDPVPRDAVGEDKPEGIDVLMVIEDSDLKEKSSTSRSIHRPDQHTFKTTMSNSQVVDNVSAV